MKTAAVSLLVVVVGGRRGGGGGGAMVGWEREREREREREGVGWLGGGVDVINENMQPHHRAFETVT